jgi:hypothetical protein
MPFPQKPNRELKGKQTERLLDTLELLDHPQCLQGFQRDRQTQKKLLQKAKNSYFSKGLAKNLMFLDSKLKKGYKRTYYDCQTTIVQQGKKLTSRYCGARWCNTCNRIRTAKLMNGYLKPIQAMEQPMFVTLTIPNVIKEDLKHFIKLMVSVSTNSIRTIKRKKIAFNGIRKFECTYNAIEDTYHPHFHFIVEGLKASEELTNEWLKRFPLSASWCQDITPLTNEIELFKYQTKIVSKADNGYYVFLEPLDTIFTAIKGMRTFQSFGNIKMVKEDIEELQSEEFNIEPNDFDIWLWSDYDWFSIQTGESLTQYKPSKKMKELTTKRMII